MTYMTKAEAAEYLRVSQATVDRWVREGRVKRYKIDGIQSARFKKDELDGIVVPDTEAGRGDETTSRS